jgi:3-phosphoglycerate kinase
VLKHLVGKVDHLIIGGGMANTFLAADHHIVRQVDRAARLVSGVEDLLGSAGQVMLAQRLDPEHPVAAVVGGAKVSTKLAVLKHLVGKVDHLIIGA